MEIFHRISIGACLLRRIGICEERGSGFDKVVSETEIYQLPAPIVEVTGDNTRVILFTYKEFGNMTKEEKIRACYFHACLKYVTRDFLTNTSLSSKILIRLLGIINTNHFGADFNLLVTCRKTSVPGT